MGDEGKRSALITERRRLPDLPAGSAAPLGRRDRILLQRTSLKRKIKTNMRGIMRGTNRKEP
jgi:hypothetical protein